MKSKFTWIVVDTKQYYPSVMEFENRKEAMIQYKEWLGYAKEEYTVYLAKVLRKGWK